MVTVRPAEPDDAAAVTRLHIRTWQSAYAGIVPAGTLAALDDQYDERVDRMRRRWSEAGAPFTTVVATLRAGPVGFASYGPYRRESGDLDPADGEVLALYVHPDHQGQGAGRALLDNAVAALRAAGRPDIRLWVLEENHPSRTFYERYGFVADGTRHLFRVTEPDGNPVDLPELRYTLSVR
jgi:ribosomal protein S18 acetylase RimI-like enzyme